LWRHIDEGTVQGYGIVMIQRSLNQAPRIFHRAGCKGPDADFNDLCQRSSLLFDLQIVRRSSHVRHTRDPNA
jgi:hypothetical protein